MENFIRHFVRIEPGKWTCVRPGEFEGPTGRIQIAIGSTFTRGTDFKGIDLGCWLEEEYQKKNGNTSPRASEALPRSTRDPIRPLPSTE